MNIDSKPFQSIQGAASADSDLSVKQSRATDRTSRTQFGDLVNEPVEQVDETDDASYRAYELAIHTVADALRVENRPLDHRAVHEVVEIAVHEQFNRTLGEDELAERVDEAMFLLAEDPAFVEATIEDLRSAIDERG